MRRILVTGHAGFIGFHVARQLLSEGAAVYGIDSLTPYYDPKLKQDRQAILATYPTFEFSNDRLEDRSRVTQIFQDFRPDVVVHLAAQAGVRYSIEAPEAYLSSNIEGTFSIIEAARSFGCVDHLLFASTSSAYGGNQRLPFRELDTTQSPMSLYAATKIGAEALTHSYSHLWRIPTTVFRFFTVYGPWGRPDMALFKFVEAILRDEPIHVFGEGKVSRDFTYIDDLVSAIRLLIDRPPVNGSRVGAYDTLSPVAPFRIVNLGGGNSVGVLEFIKAIESALGVPARQVLLPMQPGDVKRTEADNRLLFDLVGITPQTPVELGVKQFVSWYESYRGADI